MSYPAWYYDLPTELFHDKGEEHGIDPLLLAAIAKHESGGVTWRTRYEPGTKDQYLHFYRAHAERLGISQETERVAQMHSYGLMQVMGWLARAQGFKGYLGELCGEPALCVEHACILIKSLMRRYHDETDWISAYNWGHVRKTPGGLYANQKTYVDPVCHWLDELRRA